MDEKLLGTIIAAFTKELLLSSRDIFNDLYDEGKQFLGTELRKYLQKQKTKYAHIKTLLKGNAPVYLYDVYFPINLVDDKKALILTNKISNIFKKGNCATIIGDAGSGKSTLTKHLFLNSIHEKYGIPVLIELRYLNETDGDLHKYIVEKIFENRISDSPQILERLMRAGKFVFFLDGFDELNVDIKNKVVKNLNSFTTQYDGNRFVLTSRPFSNIENLSTFHNLKIKPLDEKQGDIDAFIDLQLGKEKELAKKIKQSLKENKSQFIQSFLVNPLLLTLYILTFQTNAEIPNKKYIFYRRVINALFSEHDSKTKLGYVRQKQSKLSQEQFEDILKAYCFISYFEGRFDFDFDYIDLTLKKVKARTQKADFDTHKFIYDLKSAVSLWTEDNGVYAFAHRSLQEYFAALFVKNLNPEENERAYAKIIDRLSNPDRAFSASNFLSLCCEMDEVNFSKYYLLPLLRDLRTIISNSDEAATVKSFVLFFTDGLYCGSRSHLPMVINADVYKAIYVHINFTRKLHIELMIIGQTQLVKAHASQIVDAKNRKIVKFGGEIPADVFALIMASNIKKIALEFSTHLTAEIQRIESLIARSKAADKDLLDLI